MRNCDNLSGGTSLDVFFIWSINLGLKYVWSDQLSIYVAKIFRLWKIFFLYFISFFARLVRKVFAQQTDCFLHTNSTYNYQRHNITLLIFHQFQFNFFSISWKIVVTLLQAEEHSSKVSIGQTVFDVDGRQEELFSWLESLINSSMECVAVIMA